MNVKAIQDYYTADGAARCYGCGWNNPHGHHLKSYWDGDEVVSQWKPEPYHTAAPGIVYGGIIASVIDCHSIGTAIAAAYHAKGREPGTEPPIMFVTGNLNVSYLKPSPIDSEIELRAHVKEAQERKSIVVCSFHANGEETAGGEVVAVRVRSREGLIQQ